MQNILWNPFWDCFGWTFVENGLTMQFLINKKQSVAALATLTESVTNSILTLLKKSKSNYFLEISMAEIFFANFFLSYFYYFRQLS